MGRQTGRRLLTQERHLFRSGEMSSNRVAAPTQGLMGNSTIQGGSKAGPAANTLLEQV